MRAPAIAVDGRRRERPRVPGRAVRAKGAAIRYAISLSRGLLLFWSGWLSVVFASNLADGLKQAGCLPSSWPFASGNLSLIVQAVARYSDSALWAPILFGAVVLVQLLASVLFWRAFLDPRSVSAPGHPKILQAFCAGVGLFAGFLIADELLIVYEEMPGLETTHFLVLCALLLSLTTICVLAERGRED